MYIVWILVNQVSESCRFQQSFHDSNVPINSSLVYILCNGVLSNGINLHCEKVNIVQGWLKFHGLETKKKVPIGETKIKINAHHDFRLLIRLVKSSFRDKI